MLFQICLTDFLLCNIEFSAETTFMLFYIFFEAWKLQSR